MKASLLVYHGLALSLKVMAVSFAPKLVTTSTQQKDVLLLCDRSGIRIYKKKSRLREELNVVLRSMPRNFVNLRGCMENDKCRPAMLYIAYGISLVMVNQLPRDFCENVIIVINQ